MAGRRADPGSARGGESIPSLRTARAGLIVGAVAIGTIAAIALASHHGRFAGPASGLGVAAAIVLSVALILRWPIVVPWAIALSGAGYVIGRPGVSVSTAVSGAGLLLAAELAYWAIEHDGRIQVERDVTTRRVLALVLVVSAALAVDLLLLPATALAAPRGLALAGLGAVAAVVILALMVQLARPK
jgi:hypothetical protein